MLVILSPDEIGSPDVIISPDNFPDDVFREYVRGFDTDNSGGLSVTEILAVTVIDVSNMGIATLDGIEYFTALTSLDCGGNYLTALDVSENTALSVLHADGQTLEGVQISWQGETFTVDLSGYVSGDISKIDTVNDSDSYDSETGTAVFSFLPESITYEYDTGFTNAQAKYMTVTLAPLSLDYDESVRTDIGINGLSVYPRFALPREAAVDAQEAIYTAVSSQAQNFWESRLASGISSRNVKTVFDSLKAELINKDIPQLLAVVMPVFTVSEDAWYMFKLPVEHIASNNTQIFFYDYGRVNKHRNS